MSVAYGKPFTVTPDESRLLRAVQTLGTGVPLAALSADSGLARPRLLSARAGLVRQGLWPRRHGRPVTATNAPDAV